MKSSRGKLNDAPVASSVAVAIFTGGNRLLFLEKKAGNPAKPAELWLPGCIVSGGENPVAALGSAVRSQTGIDAQIGGVLCEARYNAGSRKNKRLVPLLAFHAAAKSLKAVPSAGFSGSAWIAIDAIAKQKNLGKNALWLAAHGCDLPAHLKARASF
ncbi:MAG: hypothetical protein WC792_02460 [Candidatus Micrarchaeia archaeon]|jgi:hypothetical protein